MSIPLHDRRYGAVVETDQYGWMLTRKVVKHLDGPGSGAKDWWGVLLWGQHAIEEDILLLDHEDWRLSDREDPR